MTAADSDGFLKVVPDETPAQNAARRMGEAQEYLMAWEHVLAPSNAEDWAKSFLARGREQEKYIRAEADLKAALADEAAEH